MIRNGMLKKKTELVCYFIRDGNTAYVVQTNSKKIQDIKKNMVLKYCTETLNRSLFNKKFKKMTEFISVPRKVKIRPANMLWIP
jgi:hypothetical protein